MVGAEEVSLRIEAGTATYRESVNRAKPNANHATGIISTQFCQNQIPKKNIRQARGLVLG